MTLIYRILIIFCLLGLAACAGNLAKDKGQPIVLNKAVWNEFNHAIILLEQEKYAEAIALLQHVVEKEKRFPAPYVNLGLAYSRIGKDKLAEQQLMQALKIDPVNSKANNELGLLYRKLGRFDDAKKAYETAISKHPKYLPGRKNLAILCDIYLRDFKCAMKHFKKYQKYSSNDKQVKIWIADLKRRAGD